MLRQISEVARIDRVPKGSMINSHMTVQSLQDKFSHVGLHDAGEHAMYFSVCCKRTLGHLYEEK